MADALNDLEGEGKIVKLLVKTRLEMEKEFLAGRKKKSVLWGQVLNKIKAIDPEFSHSKEQIARKFLNLRTTYKRIKKRNKESGRSATAWSFFDDFDEVYGTRHSIDPPTCNLASSLEETVNENNSLTCDDSQVSEDDSPAPKRRKSGNCDDSQVAEDDSPAPKRKKSVNFEILEYLKKEAQTEQKRHEEIMEMEKKKLAIEQKRINAMVELKEVIEYAFKRD